MGYKWMISKFKKLHKEMIEISEKLKDKNNLLFGNWSLKDILAHMIEWNCLDSSRIISVKKGEKPTDWVPDEKLDQFNEVAVLRRKRDSWNEVFGDFIDSGNKLFKEFESVSKKVWDAPCGKNNKYSPKIYLEGMIEHYEEHISQIKKQICYPK